MGGDSMSKNRRGKDVFYATVLKKEICLRITLKAVSQRKRLQENNESQGLVAQVSEENAHGACWEGGPPSWELGRRCDRGPAWTPKIHVCLNYVPGTSLLPPEPV